jgi:uncharacterized membrane protein
MSICLWLVYQKLTGRISSLQGCGDAGSCAEVMSGPWSEWFRIPVTALAAVVHAGVLVLSVPRVQRNLGRTGDQLLAATGVILVAAAIYFLTILYAVIGGHCPWCLALHGAGFTVGILLLFSALRARREGGRGVLEAALLSGIMAMCVLGAGQIWGPKPKTFRLATLDNAASSIPSAVPPQPGAARTVSFLNGELNLNTGAVPMIGAPDSRVVLVELFDYTCKSCRLLAADLKALRRKWPDTFGVITLATPINRSCNPWVKSTIEDHEGACELARLSLAFWKANPSAFPEFHDYLFTLPLPVTAAVIDTARRKAAELTGAARMDAALADSWVASQLQQNIGTYARMTTRSVTMPKLLLHGNNFIEGVGESEAFISAIEQQFDLGGSGIPVTRTK